MRLLKQCRSVFLSVLSGVLLFLSPWWIINIFSRSFIACIAVVLAVSVVLSVIASLIDMWSD